MAYGDCEVYGKKPVLLALWKVLTTKRGGWRKVCILPRVLPRHFYF